MAAFNFQFMNIHSSSKKWEEKAKRAKNGQVTNFDMTFHEINIYQREIDKAKI